MSLIQIKGEELEEQIQNLTLEDNGIVIHDDDGEIIERNELQNALTDDDVMNRWGDISDDMRGDTGDTWGNRKCR